MKLHRAAAAFAAVTLSAVPFAASGGAIASAAISLPPLPGAAGVAGGDAAPAGITPATTPGWLVRVNSYRVLAHVPALTENSTWSNGDRLHAKYEVKNDEIGHTEDSGNPWYTAAGYQAAQTGNVMVSYSTATTNPQAVDMWMQGPFHAVGVIDPELHQTGYGSYREVIPNQNIEMSGVLDVIRGLGPLPPSVHFPVEYPSGNTALPIRSAPIGEYPNPLSGCAGYAAPSGAPIVLQIGDGSLTPHVTAHSLKLNGVVQASCEFDETNYRNTLPSEPGGQDLGREVLNERDAIVLMPKKPLKAGKTYQVSITANGHAYGWSFTVAANAQ